MTVIAFDEITLGLPAFHHPPDFLAAQKLFLSGRGLNGFGLRGRKLHVRLRELIVWKTKFLRGVDGKVLDRITR